MHPRFGFLAAILPLTAACAGCGVILGIDNFKDAPATGGSDSGGTGGAGATGGTGGTAATGGGGTAGTSGGTGGGGTAGTSGGSSGSGGSGGSGVMVCTPGDKMGCYDGPMGTEDIGICKAGMMTCKPDGSGYGPCAGQVTPATTEICSTPADDNCNGLTNLMEGCCIPNQATDCYTGPPGTKGIGECKAGTVTCNGDGTFPQMCNGEKLPHDEFCATATDEDCNDVNCFVWGHPYGGFGLEYNSAITSDTLNDKIALVGAFNGSLNLGAGTLNSTGNMNSDVFLAAYAPDSTPLWSKSFGTKEAIEAVFGVSWATGSHIAMVGRYLFGDVDFGGGLLGPAENFDGFVARFNDDGSYLFSRRLGGPGNQDVASVRCVSDGVVVAGNFDSDSVQLGDAGIDNPMMNAGAAGTGDVFVAKYDRMTDKLLWMTRIGGPGNEGISLDARSMDGDFPTSSAYITGTTSTSGLQIGNTIIAANANLFLAKLDANGTVAWAKGFHVNDFTYKVASSQLGPYLVGTVTSAVDFGTGPLPYLAGRDMVIVHFDPNGTLVFAKSYTGMGDQTLITVAADNGGVVIGGSYDTAFTLAGNALPSPAGNPSAGAFVARIDSTGADVWAVAQGGGVDAMAVDNMGFTLLGGEFSMNADIGFGPIAAVGSLDLFISKLGK